MDVYIITGILVWYIAGVITASYLLREHYNEGHDLKVSDIIAPLWMGIAGLILTILVVAHRFGQATFWNTIAIRHPKNVK